MEQPSLLPPKLEELIPEYHLVRVVNRVVEAIDLGPLLAKYKGGGTSSYHPRMMLKVLVYAYSEKIFTSRRIEKGLRENVNFMWLAGGNRPDFLLTLLLVVLVIGAFFAGYLFDHQRSDGQSYALLDEAQTILINHGLKAPPANPNLESGMIRGMLRAYTDSYTIFLDPPQNELESNRLEGKYGGIGAQLEQDSQGNWTLTRMLKARRGQPVCRTAIV